jgi:hypothetical protein
MEVQILRPVEKAIDLQGKILYHQCDRAWSLVRIRKDILNKFPQLREKRARFSYKMILHQNYNELEKAIRKLKRNKETLPILLFLYKEKTNEFS